jgi:hypothetical protein
LLDHLSVTSDQACQPKPRLLLNLSLSSTHSHHSHADNSNYGLSRNRPNDGPYYSRPEVFLELAIREICASRCDAVDGRDLC